MSVNKIKVLILAYDFPPYPSVGGKRPYSWYKYFNSFGCYPVVVTRQWSSSMDATLGYILPSESPDAIYEESETGTLIRTPYTPNFANRILIKYGESKFSFFRRAYTFTTETLQYFCPLGPKQIIYEEAKKYLENQQVDIIVATGKPFVLFKYARKLSRKFGIPWVADYRDDWIQNNLLERKLGFFERTYLSFEAYFERKYMRNVSGVTSVSDFLTAQIADRLKVEPSETIENGADLEDYVSSENPYDKSDFVILYSGILYDVPYVTDFALGFEKFLLSVGYKKNIKLYFIGIENYQNQATEAVHALAKKYPEHVIIEKRKSPNVITKYQLNASVLLKFTAGDPEKGLIGAKAYSYAVTRNPILTVPLIKNNKNAFFPGRDIQYIAMSSDDVNQFLIKKYDMFNKGESLKTSITEQEIYRLSREFNAEKMSNFIKKISHRIT